MSRMAMDPDSASYSDDDPTEGLDAPTGVESRESLPVFAANLLVWYKAECEALHDALELVLMFYDAAYWNEPQRSRWREITGKDEATTKVMCDHIRAVMATPRGEAEAP